MAVGPVSDGDLESLLECPICFDVYNVPKVLDCQHTICMSPCLENLVDIKAETVTCPICREVHPLPKEGVSGFKSNLTMVKLIDMQKITEQKDPPLAKTDSGELFSICEQCASETSSRRCVHCNTIFCGECTKEHNRHFREIVTNMWAEAQLRCTRDSEELTKRETRLCSEEQSLRKDTTNAKERINSIITSLQKVLENIEEESDAASVRIGRAIVHLEPERRILLENSSHLHMIHSTIISPDSTMQDLLTSYQQLLARSGGAVSDQGQMDDHPIAFYFDEIVINTFFDSFFTIKTSIAPQLNSDHIQTQQNRPSQDRPNFSADMQSTASPPSTGKAPLKTDIDTGNEMEVPKRELAECTTSRPAQFGGLEKLIHTVMGRRKTVPEESRQAMARDYSNTGTPRRIIRNIPGRGKDFTSVACSWHTGDIVVIDGHNNTAIIIYAPQYNRFRLIQKYLVEPFGVTVLSDGDIAISDMLGCNITICVV